MARSPKVAGSVAVFGKAMYASSPALGILFFFSMMAFVLAGSIIFMFERGHYVTENHRLWDEAYRDLCRRSEHDSTPHGCYLRQTTDGLQMEASPYVNSYLHVLGCGHDDDHGVWRLVSYLYWR